MKVFGFLLQEKAMKSWNACNAEVILYSYSIGLAISFVYILISGDLVLGIEAFAENPVESYGMAIVFSITGYFGMQAVLSLVRTFGAFVAVTVTSMRKAVSVVISFILFSKPFTIQYLVRFLIFDDTLHVISLIFYAVWRNDSDYGDILEFGIQETNGCQGTAVISDGELLSKTS